MDKKTPPTPAPPTPPTPTSPTPTPPTPTPPPAGDQGWFNFRITFEKYFLKTDINL